MKCYTINYKVLVLKCLNFVHKATAVNTFKHEMYIK